MLLRTRKKRNLPFDTTNDNIRLVATSRLKWTAIPLKKQKIVVQSLEEVGNSPAATRKSLSRKESGLPLRCLQHTVS